MTIPLPAISSKYSVSQGISTDQPVSGLTRWASTSSLCTIKNDGSSPTVPHQFFPNTYLNASFSESECSDSTIDELELEGVPTFETQYTESGSLSKSAYKTKIYNLIPSMVSKPILSTKRKGENKTLLEPDCQVGSRLRLKSVDMRDIRYYCPEMVANSPNGFATTVDDRELKILDKLANIDYCAQQSGDLIINFLRLYLLCETVRDNWVITDKYIDTIRDFLEIYSNIFADRNKNGQNNHQINEQLLILCGDQAQIIYQIEPNGILARKFNFF